MTAIPFVKSKLTVPNVPEQGIFSKRIRSFSIDKYRLVTITAPAGFGKTTAVLLSLQKKMKDVRWYRLEREDTFLPVFYTHLIQSFFSQEKACLEESLLMLESVQNLEEDYALINAQICQEAATFLQDRKEKIYLVLDDFHHVADQTLIRQSLRYFVQNMPDCVCLIITSRVDPHLVTGKMLLKGIVREVGQEELLFTLEETEELVNRKYKIRAVREQIERLLEYSEGWIAGIYLICHSPSFFDEGVLKPEKIFRKEEGLFRVFIDEFLETIDRERKNLLLYLSIPEDFSKEELRDLFRIKDAEAFVEWIEKSNLYIQKTSAEPVRYRFHSLFQTELQRLFYQKMSLQEQKSYFEMLGNYYLREMPHLAVRFFKMAEEESRALQIAAEESKKLFISDDPEKMFYLVREFRAEEIQKSPYLLLFQSMMLLNTNREECYRGLLTAMEGFRRERDYSFLMNTFGLLMTVAYQNNDFNLLQKAAGLLPVFSTFFSESAARIKLIISFFIHLVGEDRFLRASLLLPLTDRLYVSEGMWECSYQMIRGIYYYRRGELEKAKGSLEEILSHPIMQRNDQWKIIGLVSCCNTTFLSRNLVQMQEFANEFFMLGEKYGSHFATGYGHFMSAHRNYAQKNISAALDSIRKSIEEYGGYHSANLVKESETICALWDPSPVTPQKLEKARENLEFFQRERPGHGLEELGQAVYGVLQKRAGNFDEAERLLTESLTISQRKGVRQSVCALHMHLAALYFETGQDEKAVSYMEEWALYSDSMSYFFFREMDFDALEKIMDKALGNPRTAVYAKKLQALYFEESSPSLPESSDLYIRFFGDFAVEYKRNKLTDKNFKTRKVSGLLKYILIQERAVSRERLAAVFWPDSEPKAANTSLRVALYELRKTMAGFGLAFDSEEALIEEGAEGFHIRRGRPFTSDAQEMEELYERWQSGKSQDPQPLLREICSLHAGNFLEGADFDDSLLIAREHYASKFFEALHALARFSIEQQRYEEAEQLLEKALHLDSLDEISCALLLRLCRDTGQEDRAKSFRKQFCRRYEKEMGCPPDLEENPLLF